jgi:quercetin dioxygenase-like cupin family protein
MPLRRFVELLLPLLPGDFAEPLAGLALELSPAGPERLPVCRFFDAAIKGDLPLLAPLRELGPRLRWIQNPNYVAAPPSSDFLDNYGYAVLAGPGGLAETDRLALGILLLGPGIHYPTHRHPAVEIYVVLAGDAEWQKGEAGWRREKPGTVIRHDSMVPHATRALAEPLLAAYVWRGDLATYARIIASTDFHRKSVHGS